VNYIYEAKKEEIGRACSTCWEKECIWDIDGNSGREMSSRKIKTLMGEEY
jgi:hypothetical protein